jgi:hypothetical protein
MKFFKLISILILSAVLLGCSTNISKDYRIPESSNLGVAVGSITYSGILGARQVLFQNQSTGKEFIASVGTASTMNPFAKPEFDADIGMIGGLFAVELPAGEYKITAWRVVQGSVFNKPNAPINIPFSISANKSVYLGNFNFVETSRQFLYSGSTEVTLANKEDPDVKALKKRFSMLQYTPIAVTLTENLKIERLGGDSQRRIDFTTVPIFMPARR